MEAVIRTHDAELVPVENLAKDAGRRAQVRQQDGRWRVEYDPAEATYLDIKEEARHLGREVATGKFDESGISRTDERLAELREAQDRVDRLRAVGLSTEPLLDAVNRLGVEETRLREAIDDSAVDSLGSPMAQTQAQRQARRRLQQESAALEAHMFEILAQAERALITADTMRHRHGNEERATRHAERLERMVSVANQMMEQLYARRNELRDQLSEVSADPAAAEALLQTPPEPFRFNLDIERITADKAPVDVRPFDSAREQHWQNERNNATTTDEKRRVNQQMGEEAGMEGGPGWQIIAEQLVPEFPGKDIWLERMFLGVPETAGVFDHVYRIIDQSDPGKTLKVVVVESKGGSVACRLAPRIS